MLFVALLDCLSNVIIYVRIIFGYALRLSAFKDCPSLEP